MKKGINWELVNKWNEMDADEIREWSTFPKNLRWMIPLGLGALFVEGGIILSAVVFAYICYGVWMKKEYKEYRANLRQIRMSA